MKCFLAALVLCPLLAVPARPQTTTLPPLQQALSKVRQFLGLTDSQVMAIVQNNNDYNIFSFQQQDRIRQLRSEVEAETAKSQLNPMALGVRYAEIETICRGLRDKATTSLQQNISILTDVQKAKLNALNEASNLGPTISQARSGNLLPSAGLPPLAFSAGSDFSFDGTGQTVLGCSVALAPVIPFPGNVIPASRIGVPQPLPQVRQFLGLTDDQVNAIPKENSDYSTFSFQQQRQIQNAQAQIAVETSADPLDPIGLGTLYAGIESACRDLREKAATSQKQNISVLTDAQKAKLNALNDAMKLAPIISEAQSGNLLGSPNSPLFGLSPYALFGFVTGFPQAPGCNVIGRIGITIYDPVISP